MKPLTSLRSSFLALLLAVIGPLAFGQDEERPIWEQEVMLLYSGSSSEFNRLRSLGRENRRLALYTQALDTLYGKLEVEVGKQPYLEAQKLFRMIVANNDEDAIGLASAYYLARIEQSNPIEQDISEAKKLYWNLYEEWPERFFGQKSFVKYATLEIYDDDGSGDHVEERIHNLEPMISKISYPSLRQNVHRIVGEAYVGFGLDSRAAFDHFSLAYDLGISVESIRIEVLERLASLGEELGEEEAALQAYDELLRTAPWHERRAEFKESAERLRKRLLPPLAKPQA